jgi:hypothetical protein
MALLTVSPYVNSWISAVVGVTPSLRTVSPTTALTKALFPALNSPTTTSRKNSSSWTIDVRRAS